jgi:hypothetical protein
MIELIGKSVANVNFDCYLKSLEVSLSTSIVRMIKTNMVDADFDHLLHFLSINLSIQIVVVTNNHLTEESIEALYNFKKRQPKSLVSHVYLGNNYIKQKKIMDKIKLLKKLGVEAFL